MVLTPLERLGLALEGRYQIDRMLGQGGTALVFAATDLRQPRSVAIKLLRPELAALIGPGRFLREIAISAQLNHPHILPLFDSGEADGLPWFVMPLVEGESLRDRLLRERQLPLDEALRITREVADALSYAHAQGIIHRDIKPENILLSRGHALVADFGIARALDVAGGERLTETGLAVGTPTYMSPEQASGTEALDARSDVYSLACVLYEMLAGTPPFAAPTAHGVLARHMMDSVPPIRTVRNTVPEQVEMAILAAMAKAKADRFPTVAAFIEGLEGRRPSPSQPYPAVRRASRRRTLVLSLGLVALVLAAGMVYALRDRPLDTRRVLVGMLESRSGDRALAGFAADWTAAMASGLVSTGLVQAIDVRSTGLDTAAARDLARLRQVARRAGAASVVWGTYGRNAADSLTVQLHLTDAATGQVLRPLRPVVGSATNPAALTNQLQQRVMAGYAAHFDPRLHDYAIVSQPATWEAYREFQKGVGGWWEGAGIREEYTNHLRQALALDPDFTSPAIYLALFSYWDTDGCGRTDSIAAALRSSGARLLPYDQAHLDYVLALCERDPGKRYTAAGEMLRLSPDLWEAVWMRAFAAEGMHRPREAVTLLRPLERRASSSGMREMFWHLLIATLHGVGQFDSALAATRRASVEFPDNPLIDRYAMRQLAALGRVDSLNAILERRLLKSNLQRSAGEDLLFAGLELRGHRHLDAGRQTCSRAATWFDSHTTHSSSPLFRGLHANALYCAERWTEARSLYAAIAGWDTSLAALAPETRWFVQARIRLAAIAARRGDTAEVARTDRWLAQREDPEGWYGRAVLAGLSGDRGRALALFQRAWERGSPPFAHVDPDLESLRNSPEFRALLNPDR